MNEIRQCPNCGSMRFIAENVKNETEPVFQSLSDQDIIRRKRVRTLWVVVGFLVLAVLIALGTSLGFPNMNMSGNVWLLSLLLCWVAPVAVYGVYTLITYPKDRQSAQDGKLKARRTHFKAQVTTYICQQCNHEWTERLS